MKTNNYKKVLILLFVFALVFPVSSYSQSKTDSQAALEQELREIEKQIEIFSAELSKAKTQKISLTNKIKELQAKQKKLSLQIKETSLKINNLEDKIGVVEKSIKLNLVKEEQLKNDIAVLLRKINSVDNNILVALLTAEGFPNFFNEIQNYTQLSVSIKDLQDQNRVLRAKMGEEQNLLEEQKEEASSLLKIKSIQQQDLVGTISENSELLVHTKGLESNYQNFVNDRKKKAAEIRSRIYELFNTGTQINFGEAVEIAKWASGITGVSPEFLLAILTQESNLGKNVGTCNRPGDPPEKSWKVIMKPTRDHEPFLTITSDLGLDPDVTPVSCPMKDKYGKQIGWGGAMGPAQFIPSTWMGYKDRVQKITGKTPNPWDIRDAFLVAAIKLKGDGADGTYNGEWKAAMKYFAGSVNLKYRFYGDNVMAIAKKYAEEIKEL